LEKSSAALQFLQSTGHTLLLRGPAANHPTATILHARSFTSHWEASLTSHPEQAVLKSSAEDTHEGMHAEGQTRFFQIDARKVEKSEDLVAAGAEPKIVGFAPV
jgi:hypothetical protein